MKYYMVNETDASGGGRLDFTYYALSDISTLDDAKDIYTEENPWVKYQECSRMKALEIDESTYKSGLHYNQFVEVCNDAHNRNYTEGSARENYAYYGERYNIFQTRKWAEMFADAKKLVRVGYMNLHNVYKMDEHRNLHFVYHYYSTKDFRNNK